MTRRISRSALVLILVACTVAGCSGSIHSSIQTSHKNRLKLVSYHGVHVDVALGWPVLTGMQTGFAKALFHPAPPLSSDHS